MKTLTIEAPGTAALDLAPATWTIEATATGYWAPEATVVVVAGRPTAPVHSVLWPAGTVQGRFTVSGKGGQPAECSLRFRPTAGGESGGLPAGDVTCPVREGRWRCEAPVGTFDLRVRAKGYVSHYFWAKKVVRRAALDLGEMRLQPGASVVGWVATAEGRPPSVTCRVELLPASALADVPARDRVRAGSVAATVHPNERGFFHFDAVAPGTYVLTARQEGFAPATVFPVRVVATAEAEVTEPVMLERPVDLDVVIEPPVDPFGRPWVVALYRTGVRLELAPAIQPPRVAEGGQWRATGLAPGEYDLSVRDVDRNNWVSEPIRVDAGGRIHEVEVPVLAVRGSVTLGKDGLVSSLWFGQRHGRVRVRFDTDQKGRFTGFLPRSGRWDVTVEAAAPRVRRELRDVPVAREAGDAEAHVDIVLPDTTLAGLVVDEQGKPLPDAEVTCKAVAPVEAVVLTRADPEGRFELHGLPQARLALSASFQDLTSEPIEVQLTEGSKSGPHALVLRKAARLRGIVLGPNGPVMGAVVDALPVGRVEAPAEAMTDLEGRFELRVPSWAQAADLVVMARGFAFHHARIQVNAASSEPLAIAVEPFGGALTLVSDQGPPEALGVVPAVVHNGGVILVRVLARWAQMNGAAQGDDRRLVVPALEPGEYVLCATDASLAALVFAGVVPPGSRCSRSGFVVTGGDVAIALPPGK